MGIIANLDGGAAVTTNGNGAWVGLDFRRAFQVEVAGEFDGGTVTLSTLAADGSTAIPLTDSSGSAITFSTSGAKGRFFAPSGQNMRYTTAGGGASMSLRITAQEVEG